MQAMEWDVIIIGGGPAGASAGISLRASGLKVLLLDQASFPREKPCGGGIRSAALDRFPWLNAALHSTTTHFINKIQIESPDGTTLREERTEPLYIMVRRLEFDHALLRACRRAGTEVREGQRVVSIRSTAEGVDITTAGGDILRGRIVIGADGVNSVVAKTMGQGENRNLREVGIGHMEETPCAELEPTSPDTLFVFLGLGRNLGYGYLFPKQGYVNLGRGTLLSCYQAGRSGPPYEAHLRFVGSLVARGLLKGKSQRANFHGFLIPYGRPLPKTYADRILLCGDCAGLVNAFTGEGIYYALASGEHAAKTALRSIREGDQSSRFLRRYQELWKAEFGAELEQAAAIQRSFSKNLGRMDRIIQAANKDAALRRLLTDYMLGRIDYKTARMPLILGFLKSFLNNKINSLRKNFGWGQKASRKS